MNQRQIFAALQTENRQLRQHIEALQQGQNQANFIEALTCHALNAFITKGESIESAAKLAVEAAEAVMVNVIRSTQAADKALAEAEQNTGLKAVEDVPEVPEESPLILE